MDELMAAVLIIIIVLLFSYAGWSIGYEQGQIDALSGNIKFELVTHPDKTTSWEKRK